MQRKRITIKRLAVWLFLLIMVVLAVYPLIWMILSSFKTSAEFTMNKMGIPQSFTFENYIEAFQRADFLTFFKNSGLVSIISLVLMIGTASMVAYAFTRYRFRASNILLPYFTIGQMISAQMVMVAVYLMMLKIKMTDSSIGLSLVYAASGLPFAIFLLQSYFQSIPVELYEAAEIDGYNDFRIFTDVAIPLSLPGLSTVFIIQFMYVWNEFPLAFVLTGTNNKFITLSVGIYRVVNDMYHSSHTLACAGLVVTALPVLIIYALFQKQIIGGMVAGALKG